MQQIFSRDAEAVREVLGNKTVLTGFYLHGEISPSASNAKLFQLYSEINLIIENLPYYFFGWTRTEKS